MSLVNAVRQYTFTPGTRGSGAQAGRNKKTISMEMGAASSAEAEEARGCEVISGNSLFSASPSVTTDPPPRPAADAAPVVRF